MEDAWLAWAKRLQGLASTGMHFCKDEFDRERYDEVADIANRMLAALGDVPVERIHKLFPDFARAYATPLVEVRGAVIDNGRILLVREACDGLWTLPGGYADIGISPSENVVKEIREEATLKVSARSLYGIRHKAKHEYDPDPRDFYKLFFICDLEDTADPKPGSEVTAAGFFDPADLPPLSTGRTLEKDIALAFDFQSNPHRLSIFD